MDMSAAHVSAALVLLLTVVAAMGAGAIGVNNAKPTVPGATGAKPTVPGATGANPTVPGATGAKPTVPGATGANPTVPGATGAQPMGPGATGAQPTVPGAAGANDVKGDLVVAKDGSGQFKTINDALKAVPLNHQKMPFVIRIREGVYEERVKVGPQLKHIKFLGDGPTKTKITNNVYHQPPKVSVMKTATVEVIGEGFIAEDIGFENTAPLSKGTAIALLVESHRSSFQHCMMEGFSHAVFAQNNTQFYHDCTISGTGNLITGNAAAFFQSCTINLKRPSPPEAHNFVTYQSRSKEQDPTGFVLQNCTIVGAPDYNPDKIHKSYLGHPKERFARVVVMESRIESIIHHDGWTTAMDTCFFAEYHNRGPGAAQDGRLKGLGIKHIEQPAVLEYTADRFIKAGEWVRQTGVPYVGGMMNLV